MKTLKIAITSILLSLAINAQAALITITPSKNSVVIGESVALDVSVSDLLNGSAPSLADYDLKLHFNPVVFSFSSLTWGDATEGDQLDLSASGSFRELNNFATAGFLQLAELSFDDADLLNSSQKGEFRLFSAVFTATQTGSGNFFIDSLVAGDGNGNPLELTTNNGVMVSATTQVPEPSTWLIMLSALVAVGYRMRKNS